MSDNTIIRGNTAAFAKYPENVTADIRMSQHRSLFVQQFEPKYMEFARARRLYGANTGAGTAKAPVVAMPTTTATWALYNPVTSNRVLVPLQAYCWSVSGTLGLGMSLLLGVPPTKVATAPTAYASSVSNPLMPLSQPTTAIFGNAVTVAAPVWNIHASRSQVAAIEVGSGLVAELEGMYIIEPGFCLGAVILGPTGTTALFGVGFTWGELDLTLS